MRRRLVQTLALCVIVSPAWGINGAHAQANAAPEAAPAPAAPPPAPAQAPPAEAPPPAPGVRVEPGHYPVSNQLPPSAVAPPAPSQQAAPAAEGQWLNTPEYGWIWVPSGAVSQPVGGVPSAYLYTPTYGWTWYAAPWGAGPYRPGVWVVGPHAFAPRVWVHGHRGWGWHARPHVVVWAPGPFPHRHHHRWQRRYHRHHAFR